MFELKSGAAMAAPAAPMPPPLNEVRLLGCYIPGAYEPSRCTYIGLVPRHHLRTRLDVMGRTLYHIENISL